MATKADVDVEAVTTHTGAINTRGEPNANGNLTFAMGMHNATPQVPLAGVILDFRDGHRHLLEKTPYIAGHTNTNYAPARQQPPYQRAPRDNSMGSTNANVGLHMV